MLLIILQPNLNYQVNNYSPPNAASGCLGNWIRIYRNIVKILWYLCTGSLMMMIFARVLVIMKNVLISCIKEYRGPTSRPTCDVIDEVITIWNILLAWFGTIYSNLRSKWSSVWYFEIFKTAAILRSRQTFLTEVIPEVEYNSKIAMSISDILSFWSTV